MGPRKLPRAQGSLYPPPRHPGTVLDTSDLAWTEGSLAGGSQGGGSWAGLGEMLWSSAPHPAALPQPSCTPASSAWRRRPSSSACTPARPRYTRRCCGSRSSSASTRFPTPAAAPLEEYFQLRLVHHRSINMNTVTPAPPGPRVGAGHLAQVPAQRMPPGQRRWGRPKVPQSTGRPQNPPYLPLPQPPPLAPR